MIEKRHNARFIALIDEFADQISAACGMRCVEIVKPFGVVQRKSVVMTGRKRDISATCVFSRGDKIFRPVLFDFEFIYKRVVLFMVCLRIACEIPLALTYHTVKPEMNEQTEAEAIKPFDVSEILHMISPDLCKLETQFFPFL